jgi:hypothetical protein
MSELLDELSVLTAQAVDLDISLLDKKIDQMMPELGFGPEDNDRLVASYRLDTYITCLLAEEEGAGVHFGAFK